MAHRNKWLVGAGVSTVILLGAYIASARSHATVTGVVIDSGRNQPLGNVLVQIADQKQETVAATGTFYFKIKPGTHTVSIQHPGYTPYHQQQEIKAGNATKLRLELVPVTVKNSLNDDYLILPLQSGEIQARQEKTFALTRTLATGSGNVHQVAVIPQTGKTYVSLFDEGKIQVFDLARQQLLTTLEFPEASVLRQIRLSPDYKTLFVMNETHRQILRVDTETDQIQEQPIALNYAPSGFLVLPSGELAIAGNNGLETYSAAGSGPIATTTSNEFNGRKMYFAANTQSFYSLHGKNLTHISSSRDVQTHTFAETPQSLVVDSNSGDIYIAFKNTIQRFPTGQLTLNEEPIFKSDNAIVAITESTDSKSLWVVHQNAPHVTRLDKKAATVDAQTWDLNSSPIDVSRVHLD